MDDSVDHAYIPCMVSFGHNQTIKRLEKPRWSHVREVVNKLTANYSAPPIPALEIAENNGVDVVFADFGTASERVAGFCDFPSSKLYVNADDQTERQTFTIAHELGHWILHRSYFDLHPDEYETFPRFQSVAENDAFEKEANFFAANLLVPVRLLKPVREFAVSDLARAFGVSRTMMEFRLKNV